MHRFLSDAIPWHTICEHVEPIDDLIDASE
jgi:hypothetical protein